MKNQLSALVFIMSILAFSSCEKTNISGSNFLKFSLDEQTQLVKNVTVTKTAFFEDVFPGMKQYRVLGLYYPKGSNYRSEMKFFFVEQKEGLILHDVSFGSKENNISGYGMDSFEDRFKQRVSYTISQKGSVVTCNFKIAVVVPNQPTRYITDGVCTFDLANVQ